MYLHICSHQESATSNTLFHKVKFSIRKAFFIVFEMSTSTKSFSASYVSVPFSVAEKTAHLFMLKTLCKVEVTNPILVPSSITTFIFCFLAGFLLLF